MMDRRDALADIAITVLARDGGRGLTHRAVDRLAGLSEGSCSYYFRTRSALLHACVDRLAARTLEDIPHGAASPATPQDLVEVAVSVVDRWLTSDRDRLVARWELSLEATRRPDLQATLQAAGARVREAVAGILRELGVADAEERARDLVACLDGLAFDHVVGPDRGAPGSLDAAVTAVVDAFVGPR